MVLVTVYLIDLAQKILSVDSLNDIDLEYINSITLALINNGSTPLSADIDWDSLADIFVRLYAQHLIPNGQRSVRMRAARVNYFLRALTAPLSPDLPPNIQSSTYQVDIFGISFILKIISYMLTHNHLIFIQAYAFRSSF